MNIRQINIALLICIATSNHLVFSSQILYVSASHDKAVFAYTINEQTGELAAKFKTDLPFNPGVMAFSPQKTSVYVDLSVGDDAYVATLQRNNDGALSLRGKSAITSRSTYICTDNGGQFLLTCHYVAGDVSIYRIVDGVCTDELVEHQKTERTAHCIALEPSGRFVFVPHTAPNKVYQFRFDLQKGTLAPNDPPSVEGPDKNHKYHEPRHYVHHPQLDVGYTSNEFGGGITMWKFDPLTGTLKRLKTLSTLSPDSTGNFYAADIQLTPNGRFVYVSNRDQTERQPDEPRHDTLTGFSLDSRTGEMTLVGSVPTPNQPRSFCIDHSGRFVYSAGTTTSTLFAYRIDQQTGSLEHFATYKTGGGPTWVMCSNVRE